jgi:hypothetical protein
MMTLFLSSLEYRAALTHRVSPLPILQTGYSRKRKVLAFYVVAGAWRVHTDSCLVQPS